MSEEFSSVPEFPLQSFGKNEKKEENKENEITTSKEITKEFVNSIDFYDIGRMINCGGFGRVYMVRTKSKPHAILAMKLVHKEPLERHGMTEQFEQEIKILCQLPEHENIIQFYTHFEDATRCYLMLEYAYGGCIFDVLKVNKRLSSPIVATWISQLCDCLLILHQNGIIHRDIKPENILLGVNGEIKLTDFGWSKLMNKLDETLNATICGTFEYMPPEMLIEKPYTSAIDIWCIGILMYELSYGRTPFHSIENEKELKEEVFSKKIKYDFFSSTQTELLNGILQVNPIKRMPLADISSHIWIRTNKKTTKPYFIIHEIPSDGFDDD
ncbi:hypothetical protein SNEBB_006798 [Seison nebaliae]|nr:hypothetical protein SNEBB_006798 [Seison nebaliae]